MTLKHELATSHNRLADYPNIIHHPLRARWDSMKARCLNSNDKHYADYHDRNIKITNAWLESPKYIADVVLLDGFEWSKLDGNKGITLDRINNDKGYFPDNCRWVYQPYKLIIHGSPNSIHLV